MYLAPILAFLVVMTGGTPMPSQAQSLACVDRDLVSCVGSSDCMLSSIANQTASMCTTPVDRCQIGFRQSILDATGQTIDNELQQVTIQQCKARIGCAYVPAEQCYCPPDVVCVCGGGAPPTCVEMPNVQIPAPTGDFVIVDVRNVSGVAAPLDLNAHQDILGQALSLSAGGLGMQGLECDAWTIQQIAPVLDFFDPLLSDVLIDPVDYPESDGDARILTSWTYSCEGEHFLNLLHVDNRLVVIPWANGSKYLIGEVPMSNAAVTKLQAALKNVNFYDGPVTGELDEHTLVSVSNWYEYRSSARDLYRFARTAISRNLFDAMGVF